MFSAGDKLLLLNIGFHTSFLGWLADWLASPCRVSSRLALFFRLSLSIAREQQLGVNLGSSQSEVLCVV